MSQKYSIHWFRRDLRVVGNENLRFAFKHSEKKVLGIFCFDSAFLSRPDFSANRFAFFIKTLKQLKFELQQQGGDLLIVDDQPHVAFSKLFEYFKKNSHGLPEYVTYGKDYEPFARERDEKVKKLIETYGVKTHSERDHLLIEPHEVTKDDGSFYQVYSPFARKWFDKLATVEVQKRVAAQKNAQAYFERIMKGDYEKIFDFKWSEFENLPYQDSLEKFEAQNNKSVTIPIPEAGFAVAYKRLLEFKNHVNKYKDQRDIPSYDGTSMMSIYLKNGSITSAQIIYALGLKNQNFKTGEQATQYIKEIAWREFYYSIIYNKPEVEKQAFLEQYKNLPWENNKEWFQCWCEGKTGYPIVDAGMRQLNTTGWMHNRVRMIVASFLVKDLLIDWRWGENYFMKMLLDGDLAPNNGGWQWAASTGCDPQPYFRIFNPWLQAAKFDPEAKYIKTYVPELKDISPDFIHDADSFRGSSYPPPIVVHAQQKDKAISLFKKNNGKE
jgi:deoxyribodipyrimidine photo-lyase